MNSAVESYKEKIHPESSLMVLVVDDDRESSEALAQFLSLKGHGVQCATNGGEALQLLTETHDPPALIFLDLMMPVLDGWGFLELRAKNPVLAEVPVVVISGCRDVSQRAKEAGAVAFLRKPVEPQILLRVVEHFDQSL